MSKPTETIGDQVAAARRSPSHHRQPPAILFREHPELCTSQVIAALFDVERNHQESLSRSERAKAAWTRRRAAKTATQA